MGRIKCNYCSESIEADSKFCINCGSTVEVSSKSKQPKRPLTEEIYEQPAEFRRQEKAPKLKSIESRRKRITTGVIITFVLLGSLGVVIPIVLVNIYGPFGFDYLGESEFTSDALVTTNATLIIDNVSGNIEITYDSAQTEIIKATIDVYGRSEANITNAENFTIAEAAGTIEFAFINEEIYSFFNKTTMYYDLDITLNPDVDFKFDITAFSGDITMDFTDSINSNITQFDINTFSGNIEASFGSSINIVNSTFDIEASSGNIDLLFGSNLNLETGGFAIDTFSGNIYIESTSQLNLETSDIYLQASSGNIEVDFGLNATVTADTFIVESFSGNSFIDFGVSTDLHIPYYKIDVSSGNVDLILDEVKFYEDTEWIITTFSGDITIELNPTLVPAINYTADFAVTASSGNIEIYYDMNEDDIGIEISASASSGSIDLPNDMDYYKSSGFDLRTIQYIFDLDTFSGNIDVYEDL